MSNDGAVKCPVCGGLSQVENAELRAALGDPNIRKQIEEYVAGLVPVAAGPRSFQKDVHNWNPAVAMWQRSPKE